MKIYLSLRNSFHIWPIFGPLSPAPAGGAQVSGSLNRPHLLGLAVSVGLDRADEGGRWMNDQIPGDGDFNVQDGDRLLNAAGNQSLRWVSKYLISRIKYNLLEQCSVCVRPSRSNELCEERCIKRCASSNPSTSIMYQVGYNEVTSVACYRLKHLVCIFVL